MKRVVLLLALAITLFAQTTGGFTVNVIPYWHGLIVTFQSDNPQTVAFMAEVRYTLQDETVPRTVETYCMARFGGGGTILVSTPGPVGTTSVHGWEITGIGRGAFSPNQ